MYIQQVDLYITEHYFTMYFVDTGFQLQYR